MDALADRGAITIGVDTPSVDVATATELVSHHRFLARGVAILEGDGRTALRIWIDAEGLFLADDTGGIERLTDEGRRRVDSAMASRRAGRPREWV